MWRPRDRERFIGSYDPEHEMPDPDRGGGDRWQSDAYRHGARDTRFAYRFNPDAIERGYEGPRRDIARESELRWHGDARDRGYYDRGYRAGYEAGYGGYDRDRWGDYDRSFDRGWNRDFDRDRDYDRGGFMTGPRLDRDQNYGPDRGWDSDRGERSWDRTWDRPGDRGYEDWRRDWRRRQ